MPGYVYKRNAYGEVGRFSPENWRKVVESGEAKDYQDSSQAEFDKTRETAKYSTAGQTALGAGEAVVRGASLNTSDIASGLISPEYAAEARKRQEALGGLGTGLEVLGAAVPTLLTGGTGAAAKGGVTAAMRLTPAALVARGAEAGGALVRSGLGKEAATAGGRILQAAIPLAAEGAIEGAVSGATQAAGQAALEGTPITAEKVIAGAGENALWGGIMGGGIGAAGRALTESATALGTAGDRFADRMRRVQQGDASAAGKLSPAEGDALEGAVEAVTGQPAAKGLREKAMDYMSEKYAQAASVVTGVDEKAIREYGPLARGEKASAGRKLWREKDQLHDGFTRRMHSDLDELIVSSKAPLDEVVERRLKRSGVQKNLSGVNENFASAAAREEMANMRRTIEEIANDADTYGDKAFAKRLEKFAEEASQRLDAGKAADAYIELDNFKRGLQKKINQVGTGLSRQSDPTRIAQAQAFINKLEPQQESMRRFLENSNVWGQQGAAQQAVNAAFKRHIDAKRAGLGHFTQRTGTEYGGAGGRPIIVADPSKLSGYLKRTGTAEGALADKQFADYVSSTEELTQAIRDNYDVSPEVIRQVEQAETAAKKMRATLSEMDETVKVVNQVDSLMNASGPQLGGLGGVGVGAVIGGAPGAILGGIASAVSNPGSIVRKMMVAEDMMKRVARFDGEADAAISRAVAKPTIKTLRARASGATQGAEAAIRRAAVPATVYGTTTVRERRRKEYQSNIESVRRFASDPEHAISSVSASVQINDLPQLNSQAQSTVARAMHFLDSKIPAPPKTGGIVAKRTVVSDAEMAQMERYLRAIKNPLVAIHDLEKNRLTSDTIDAIKHVYPNLFSELQAKTWQTIQERGDIPAGKVTQLSLLFDIDGSNALKPETLLRRVQESQELAKERQQAQRESKARRSQNISTKPPPAVGSVGLEMRRAGIQ